MCDKLLVGVLTYQWAGNAASGATWRVRAAQNGLVEVEEGNPRPAMPPEVGGRLKVASFNVLNFFNTLDDGSAITAIGAQPRGADDLSRFGVTPATAEFDRQLAKLVTTILALDADVLGLVEVENDFLSRSPGNATEALVDALNDATGAGTYAWVDPGTQFVGDDSIAVGMIYQTSSVELTPGTSPAVLGDKDLPDLGLDALPAVFDGDATNRAPLAVSFTEVGTGEVLTVSVNHFKSKGSPGTAGAADGDQRDGAGFANQTRLNAARALAAWLNTDPTGSGDPDHIIIGDLNAYPKEDPITYLEGIGYTDVAQLYGGDEAYSYVFDGQTGTLDYALANATLLEQVAGASEWHINADEADALDYNLDFGRPSGIFDGGSPYRTSDHDPLLVGLDLGSGSQFQLQILHTSDQEAGIAAFNDAPGLSAVLNALEDDYANTLKLSSGDLYIAGPFFSASTDIYEEGFPGVADILIQNELGWDAAAVGNHEFDAGDEAFFELVAPNPELANGSSGGQGIGEEGYPGTLYPYLATNLDYSEASLPDGLNLVESGNAPVPHSLTGSVVVDVNGEPVGVLGAVTPYLPTIANTGDVQMLTGDSITPSTPIADQVTALIENLTPEVEKLTSAGINKVVLMTHLQEAEIEQALAQALAENNIPVDVLIGGGSHRVMASEDDALREDETQQTNGQLLEPYPQVFTAGDNTVYYVNTDANYRYLSQLVVTFDENGVITEIGDDSGTYATDIAGVDRLYDADITSIEEVKAVADPELVAIVEGVQGFVNKLDGDIFGQTDVYLNGIRGDVRTQETNLGNLAADAQDFYAEEYLKAHGDDLLSGFESIDISFKNGGGIRDQIGQSFVPGGGGELVQLPPEANPEVGKEEGDISALDISNSLRFDNTLVVGKTTAAGVYDLFEHAVSGVEITSGRFAQISGIQYSFDPAATPRSDTVAGERIQNLVVLNDDGSIKDVVVEDGELVGDPDREFSITTLEFLAEGGDGYPNVISDQKLLSEFSEPQSLGAADLASGGEQDALAEYLSALFNEKNGQQAFMEADTERSADERIQNLAFRDDTILEGVPSSPDPLVPEFGSLEGETIDIVTGNQLVFAGAGNDLLLATESAGGNTIFAGSGDDVAVLGAGDTYFGNAGDDRFFAQTGGNNVITGGAGSDQFWISSAELPEAANTIQDFTIGEDLLGVAGISASFETLTITQTAAGATIAFGPTDLARLNGIQAIDLTAMNFVFG